MFDITLEHAFLKSNIKRMMKIVKLQKKVLRRQNKLYQFYLKYFGICDEWENITGNDNSSKIQNENDSLEQNKNQIQKPTETRTTTFEVKNKNCQSERDNISKATSLATIIKKANDNSLQSKKSGSQTTQKSHVTYYVVTRVTPQKQAKSCDQENKNNELLSKLTEKLSLLNDDIIKSTEDGSQLNDNLTNEEHIGEGYHAVLLEYRKKIKFLQNRLIYKQQTVLQIMDPIYKLKQHSDNGWDTVSALFYHLYNTFVDEISYKELICICHIHWAIKNTEMTKLDHGFEDFDLIQQDNILTYQNWTLKEFINYFEIIKCFPDEVLVVKHDDDDIPQYESDSVDKIIEKTIASTKKNINLKRISQKSFESEDIDLLDFQVQENGNKSASLSRLDAKKQNVSSEYTFLKANLPRKDSKEPLEPKIKKKILFKVNSNESVAKKIIKNDTFTMNLRTRRSSIERKREIKYSGSSIFYNQTQDSLSETKTACNVISVPTSLENLKLENIETKKSNIPIAKITPIVTSAVEKDEELPNNEMEDRSNDLNEIILSSKQEAYRLVVKKNSLNRYGTISIILKNNIHPSGTPFTNIQAIKIDGESSNIGDLKPVDETPGLPRKLSFKKKESFRKHKIEFPNI